MTYDTKKVCKEGWKASDSAILIDECFWELTGSVATAIMLIKEITGQRLSIWLT